MKANTIYTKALNNNKDSLYELMYNIHDQLFQLGHVKKLTAMTEANINFMVNRQMYDEYKIQTAKAMAIQYIYDQTEGEIQ